jgi:hypothetical protein
MKLPVMLLMCLAVISSCHNSPQQNLVAAAGSADTAVIKELRISDAYKFPVVEIQEQAKADKINSYLVNAALGGEYNITNLKSKLEDASRDFQASHTGMASIEYKVLSNAAPLLSINISSCYQGNRENCDEVQYNFDLTTGYTIALDQIILPSKKEELRSKILEELGKRLQESKKSLIEEGRWSVDYQKAIDDQERQALLEFKPEGFRLSREGITFVYYCMPFAMADRAYFPSQDYLFTWQTLRPYLIEVNPITSLYK